MREDREEVSWRHPDFYVLWPLGMQGQFPRWQAGLEFDLTLQYRTQDEVAVKAAVRDWILFGGVGGRTRRGCGAVGVREQTDREWLGLPGDAKALAGSGATAAGQGGAKNVLSLSGASIVAGAVMAQTKSVDAWRTAYVLLSDSDPPLTA